MARSHHSHKCRSSGGNKSILSEAELVYQAKKYYYGIQANDEQLKISEEVRGHFEKAVTEAEEKFETADGEITQSAITKLKLGLSGTLNDLAQFENDKKLSQLRLGKLIGREIHDDVEMGERSLERLEFPFQTVAEYLTVRKSSAQNNFELKEAMIKTNKANPDHHPLYPHSSKENLAYTASAVNTILPEKARPSVPKIQITLIKSICYMISPAKVREGP